MSITFQESVMSVSRITLEKNKMTYIYDHSKGTIISDEKPELKDKKTRKPGAVPPKTNTIKIGIRNQGYVEVTSGLDKEDIIAAEGLKKVRPNGKIKPINK